MKKGGKGERRKGRKEGKEKGVEGEVIAEGS